MSDVSIGCRRPASTLFSASVTGEPSVASSTSPSKNAYVASKNALEILDTNALGIGRLPVREEDDDDDGASAAPLANLNAHVVACRWKK